MANLKTWVNIDSAAIKHNFKTIKSLLKPKTELWAVVKSNAYGHGLLAFSKIADKLGVDGFCVDSVLEAKKLRDEFIKKPVLVLGPTLPDLFANALRNNITITISTMVGLKSWFKSKYKPNFHIKIDTGMYRQGFYPTDMPAVIKQIKGAKSEARNLLRGVYTHFASAKDINYPTYTDLQFSKFLKVVSLLGKSGFKDIKKHVAATAGTLINPKYQLDAVRIGIGLYGLWPSKELEIQLSDKIRFQPVLSWHAIVSEVKNVPAGSYIGYDMTERVSRPIKMAIVPIGYWHGFPRTLSGTGEILIKGKPAKVLGRVSMDLISVDVTGISCKAGDVATLIGSSYEMAQKTGTSHYEIVTRINPLIERVVK